ncbi:MAG TPA: DNA repair protein RadA [bacterium]|nr:DNA repair protein RadA [bacterium]
MPKNNNLIYSCSACGAQYTKWQGRCLECGKWGTINQEIANSNKDKNNLPPDQPIKLDQLPNQGQARIATGLAEFDRVLGGGIVAGSLILFGGDPGIGKSTLALQIAGQIPNTLYASGEESGQQVKLRAQRLNINLANFQFLGQNNIEKIIATAKAIKPPLLIVDSIQTANTLETGLSFGSANQITAVTVKLLELAKTANIPIIIIGHVTKEGYVAGPKTLEHLVDTVLYLENDNKNHFKILRSVKNRFGSIGEVGVFEMADSGLKEIANPSQIFLGEYGKTKHPGIMTAMVFEGSRPFVVEVQALTSKTMFGYPQRKAAGIDLNRLQMLTAVIGKKTKLNLVNQDIYLNLAGGFKTKNTATDLAICLAIASSFLDSPLANDAVAIGEVGLSGELRPVTNISQMIQEAQKLNFKKIIVPLQSGAKNKKNLIEIDTLTDGLKIIFKK